MTPHGVMGDIPDHGYSKVVSILIQRGQRGQNTAMCSPGTNNYIQLRPHSVVSGTDKKIERKSSETILLSQVKRKVKVIIVIIFTTEEGHGYEKT